MINIYDPLFKLGDDDLLSVNGPLSSTNINDTIKDMVMGIASTLGYANVSEFDYNTPFYLDCIYDNSKSLCIPIFNEKVNNNELGYTLTDSNVSFLILTSKSGKINHPFFGTPTDNYCCTYENGEIFNDQDIEKVNNYTGSGVMCKRLYNLKLFRYANQDNGYKFDSHPIDLDLITGLYYGYKKNNNNDNIEEVELCIDDFCNFYFNQQIMEIRINDQNDLNIINTYPYIRIIPNNYYNYLVPKNNIKKLGNDSSFNYSFNINKFSEFDASFCCHIFNKIYIFN